VGHGAAGAGEVPYPAQRVRSVTLLTEGGRLWLEVTAELPIVVYPAGTEPLPERVAGVDLGMDLPAGRRHNLRLRQWQVGRLIALLTAKATLAGISVHLVDERGTSSTCPGCRRRISKPRGRVLTCSYCGTSGHRDLVAAATIATRIPGGVCTTASAVCMPRVVTHRRAGRHLPGAGTARRDPRRHHHSRGDGGAGVGWPAVARPTHPVGSRSTAPAARIHNTVAQPGER
jgi:hypothetical protein